MDKDLLKKLIAEPGKKHQVADFETDDTATLTKDQAKKLLKENIKVLASLQDKLYAFNKYAVLIVFQAMDAAGKDGTIKNVMSGINPQGCQVFSFKKPSDKELDHGYLWRIQKNAPERGRIGIFNRSHYEDVLVGRVHPEIFVGGQIPEIDKIDDVNERFWEKRYSHINDFERYLTETGTVIIKFFLNVSKEEQKKRFLKRLNREEKNWKFSSADLEERQYWDCYMDAYGKLLTKTSTDYAPWYVIPADHKWFMRYAVSNIICERLEELQMSYPQLSKEETEQLKIYREHIMKEEEESKKK